MNKELILGCAYYPEYLPYDRMDTDFSMMEKAGLNVIRIAESTWSTLEPEEGIFCFQYIDEVLKKAPQYNLHVIIGTPTYAIPSWLARKHPDILTKPYGARQIMDITNPHFRAAAEKVIRKLLEHTAENPSVIGFQIDNETKYYDASTPHIRKLFLEHLKEVFHTTKALNQAYGLAYWSNSISNWDDFPEIDGTINAGLKGEYDRFRRHLAAEYLQWQADLVSEYKRSDQFITHNFDFDWNKEKTDVPMLEHSYGVQKGINHFEASKALDLAGCDIYHPTGPYLSGKEIAFCGDSTRCLKNQSYLVIETQAQGFRYWTPYQGQLRLHAYSHLASGALGLMYWHWHSIHNSFETYWKGILSHDMKENRIYREISSIGKEWQDHSFDLVNLKKCNAVCLVVDNHSQDALEWPSFCDPEHSYNDIIRWVYDALFECNIECDIRDINDLHTESYQMIVLPAAYSLKEETIQKLRSFVSDGGILFATYRSFFADDHFSVYDDVQPHHMCDVFGIHYDEIAQPYDVMVEDKPVSGFMELIHCDKAEVCAYYQHPEWNQYAAITHHQFGNGEAWYIGSHCESDVLKKYLLKAYHALDPNHTELRWPLIIRNCINPEGNVIHFILHYQDTEETIQYPYEESADLLSGTKYKKNDPVTLTGYDVRILKEEKRI